MPVVPAGGNAGAGEAGATGATGGNDRVRAAQSDVQAARRAVDDAAVSKGMTSEDAAAARKRLNDARRELNQAWESAARSNR
jgi:hypothetical protein